MKNKKTPRILLDSDTAAQWKPLARNLWQRLERVREKQGCVLKQHHWDFEFCKIHACAHRNQSGNFIHITAGGAVGFFAIYDSSFAYDPFWDYNRTFGGLQQGLNNPFPDQDPFFPTYGSDRRDQFPYNFKPLPATINGKLYYAYFLINYRGFDDFMHVAFNVGEYDGFVKEHTMIFNDDGYLAGNPDYVTIFDVPRDQSNPPYEWSQLNWPYAPHQNGSGSPIRNSTNFIMNGMLCTFYFEECENNWHGYIVGLNIATGEFKEGYLIPEHFTYALANVDSDGLLRNKNMQVNISDTYDNTLYLQYQSGSTYSGPIIPKYTVTELQTAGGVTAPVSGYVNHTPAGGWCTAVHAGKNNVYFLTMVQSDPVVAGDTHRASILKMPRYPLRRPNTKYKVGDVVFGVDDQAQKVLYTLTCTFAATSPDTFFELDPAQIAAGTAADGPELHWDVALYTPSLELVYEDKLDTVFGAGGYMASLAVTPSETYAMTGWRDVVPTNPWYDHMGEFRGRFTVYDIGATPAIIDSTREGWDGFQNDSWGSSIIGLRYK